MKRTKKKAGRCETAGSGEHQRGHVHQGLAAQERHRAAAMVHVGPGDRRALDLDEHQRRLQLRAGLPQPRARRPRLQPRLRLPHGRVGLAAQHRPARGALHLRDPGARRLQDHRYEHTHILFTRRFET